ncbi:MAG: hypothetical protein QM533_10365 [Cytophagales bacterium]|nr:hypothetical protein [Cytophagales bacterium]
MKTTLELSDALFYSAKEFAKQSQTTLRALVEEGLRRVLGEQTIKTKTAFKLRDASVGGAMLADGRAMLQMYDDHVLERQRRVDADMQKLWKTKQASKKVNAA